MDNKITPQERFVEWLFQTVIIEGHDFDSFDVQEGLEKFGLIEERPVNPDENEWNADKLYFLVEPKKAISKATMGGGE